MTSGRESSEDYLEAILVIRREQSMTAESAGSPYVKVPCRSRTPRETPYGDRKMPIEFDLSFTGPETA